MRFVTSMVVLLLGCATEPRQAFEINQEWSGVIDINHAEAALRHAPDAVNCGAHDFTRSIGNPELPPTARRCLRQAIHQGLPYRFAIVRITGDVILQTAIVHAPASKTYWYASLDKSADGSEWGIKVEQCEKLEIEWTPLFFDARGCREVDADHWWKV